MIKQLKEQTLKLPEKERAELAHLLIGSLNRKKEFKTRKEWSNEIKNRIDSLEQGNSSINFVKKSLN